MGCLLDVSGLSLGCLYAVRSHKHGDGHRASKSSRGNLLIKISIILSKILREFTLQTCGKLPFFCGKPVDKPVDKLGKTVDNFDEYKCSVENSGSFPQVFHRQRSRKALLVKGFKKFSTFSTGSTTTVLKDFFKTAVLIPERAQSPIEPRGNSVLGCRSVQEVEGLSNSEPGR